MVPKDRFIDINLTIYPCELQHYSTVFLFYLPICSHSAVLDRSTCVKRRKYSEFHSHRKWLDFLFCKMTRKCPVSSWPRLFSDYICAGRSRKSEEHRKKQISSANSSKTLSGLTACVGFHSASSLQVQRFHFKVRGDRHGGGRRLEEAVREASAGEPDAAGGAVGVEPRPAQEARRPDLLHRDLRRAPLPREAAAAAGPRRPAAASASTTSCSRGHGVVLVVDRRRREEQGRLVSRRAPQAAEARADVEEERELLHEEEPVRVVVPAALHRGARVREHRGRAEGRRRRASRRVPSPGGDTQRRGRRRREPGGEGEPAASAVVPAPDTVHQRARREAERVLPVVPCGGQVRAGGGCHPREGAPAGVARGRSAQAAVRRRHRTRVDQDRTTRGL